MCTHQCLDCFLSNLKRHPGISSSQYQILKQILISWSIGHFKSAKIDYQQEFTLSHFELYILFLFASKSINCQDLIL